MTPVTVIPRLEPMRRTGGIQKRSALRAGLLNWIPACAAITPDHTDTDHGARNTFLPVKKVFRAPMQYQSGVVAPVAEQLFETRVIEFVLKLPGSLIDRGL